MMLPQTAHATDEWVTAARTPEGRFRVSMSRAWHLLLLLIAALAAGWAYAEPVYAANALENVSFSALPGDRVQVVLTLAQPAAEPVGFTTDHPARIALDLADTTNQLSQKSQAIGVGVARSIATAQADGRTRVVLNLVQLVPYATRVEGKKIVITLASAPAQAPAAMQAGAETAGAATGAGITGVDFRRGDAGQALITVDLSNPSISWNLHEEGKAILVDFMNASLPERLEQRLDVTDFATPVTTVDTYAQGNGVRLAITPHGEYEDMAYQAGDKLTIEVKPVTAAQKEAAAKEKFKYTGQRLSLDFQDIQTRAVLQLIADFTNTNIVVSDSVKGSITLHLKNVPWDQALAIILQTKGLAMRRSGNVIMVAPSDEMAAREKLEAEAQKQMQKLEPLKAEFIQVNYAKAQDIAKLLQSKQGGQDNSGFLSSRGSVTVDARTNTLLVQDTPSNLDKIRKLVQTLDIPVRQVLIDSRVVIANNNWSRDLGSQFGFSRSTTYGNNGNFYTVGGTQAGTTTFPGGTTGFQAPAGSGNEGLISTLPVANPTAALGIAIGRIGSHLLQLQLSAMQAENKGEIVSSPRVITANDMTATIEQGVEIPYQQATSSGATSVQFKKAVLSLKVTPHITPDDRIIMDLLVNKDSVGQVFFGVPSIDTSNVQTQVLVDNGETVVLGGIYQHTDTNEKDTVPVLGDIPGIGFLFRNTQKVNDRSELLIFVTPKIMKDTLRVDQMRLDSAGAGQ
ncbi:MAG TPA: type IV pilus secretin PilQ [Gammaproteobacteria bacterium]|nr:type IV pilus secretin PilQ [Gammaproteobacteria bacterium]